MGAKGLMQGRVSGGPMATIERVCIAGGEVKSLQRGHGCTYG